MFQSKLSFAVPVLTETFSMSSLEALLEDEYVRVVCEYDPAVRVGVGDIGEIGLEVSVALVSVGDGGEGMEGKQESMGGGELPANMI